MNILSGFIEHIDNVKIICRLSNIPNNDIELSIGRIFLTNEQNKIIEEGSQIKYNKENGDIKFLDKNSNLI